MVISDAPIEQDIYVIGPRRNISSPFTPRLGRDKRSNARLSAWRAPSFNEPFGGLFFSRQNRQILLFCLGFIFPFGKLVKLQNRLNSRSSTYAYHSMDDCRVSSFAYEPGTVKESDAQPGRRGTGLCSTSRSSWRKALSQGSVVAEFKPGNVCCWYLTRWSNSKFVFSEWRNNWRLISFHYR